MLNQVSYTGNLYEVSSHAYQGTLTYDNKALYDDEIITVGMLTE